MFTHIFEMLPVDAAKQLASPASAVLAFWPGPSCLPDCCHFVGLQHVCRILGCTCWLHVAHADDKQLHAMKEFVFDCLARVLKKHSKDTCGV